MKKEVKIRVLVKTVPHPNPQVAIDLIANILVNQLLKDKNDGGTSMYLAQAPSNKTIRGKAIIKAIEKTIGAHGYPFFFQYHHGLFINIPTNDFQISKIGNYGGLNFYYGEAMPITLFQNYVSIEPVKTPDNLNRDLKACFLIRQECTKEVLGWLCWE